MKKKCAPTHALDQDFSQQRQLAPAWQSPLWEDFPDVDWSEEEPPFDVEFDAIGYGPK